MGWSDIDLSSLSTETKTLPEQKFTFEIVSAKDNPWKEGKVDVTAKVAEGEFEGEITYFSYPEPDDEKFAWVKGVLARMFGALGEKPEPGEEIVPYFRRMKGKQFVAPIVHRVVQYEGHDQIKAEIKIGNVSKVK